LRILVIEDEPKVARTLVKGLEADHFAVDLAGDGEEGLQLATEIDYDGIVLDWNCWISSVWKTWNWIACVTW